MKQSLLQQFSADRPQFLALEALVLAQLKVLLQDADLKIHSLSARIKAPESLAYKLRRPDRTYHQLSEITDLVGVRIITYFEDSIAQLAALVEQAFEIDYTHSIDKRQSADLAHFLLLRSSALGIERLEKLTRFYQRIDYPHDEKQARAVARQLIETIQTV